MYRQRFPISFHGDTHDTVWHCQSSFRPRLTFGRQKKQKKKEKNLSRVRGLGSCRIVICAVQSKPQKRMDRVGLALLWSFWLPIYVVVPISNVNRSVTAIRTDCDTTASAWCRRDYCYLQNSVLKVLYIFTHNWDRGGKLFFFFFLEYINEYIKTPGAKFKKKKKKHGLSLFRRCVKTRSSIKWLIRSI